MKKIIIAGALLSSSFFLSACTAKQTQSPESSSTQTATTPSPTSANNTQPKTFTLTEVAQHASETDCWMAVEDKVYDVTSFVSKHPGGKAILNGCGKDATTLFNERPTNNRGPHPAQAKEQLKQFEIGILAQ